MCDVSSSLSTLIRHENGASRNRSPYWRNLRNPVNEDGTRVENGAFPKLSRDNG